MSIRSNEVYVSWRVNKCLTIMARCEDDSQITPDMLANQILEHEIQTKRPEIWEYVEFLEKTEKEFLKKQKESLRVLRKEESERGNVKDKS